MKKNGTTTKGTTRWRCTSPTCGASTTKTRPDRQLSADFNTFIDCICGGASAAQVAASHNISRRSLERRFYTFWFIDIPHHIDSFRIYDQIFIDGTYTGAGCLLIAATRFHVLNWVWAKHETAQAYQQLLEPLQPPLMVVLDGGTGAYSAIRQLWPQTTIQRCLVHAQRVVRRHVTQRPRTDAGKAIYALALELTQVDSLDKAAQWTAQLQQFHDVYRLWMNEKTLNIYTGKREFTHIRVRRAFNSLSHLSRQQWLFAFLQPAASPADPNYTWAATTNHLEGAINAQLKLLARLHRGRGGERQRRMLEWWLYLHTEDPIPPAQIAKEQNWGRDALAKVHATPHNENKADQQTGRPALYDNAIPDSYEHSLGIQKGWAGT